MNMIKKDLYLVETEEETFSFPGGLVHWIIQCLEKNYECYVAMGRSLIEIPNEIENMINIHTFKHFPIVYYILSGEYEGTVKQIHTEN
jgi:hypothetical protein